MISSRDNLYLILSVCCFVGYLWLLYSYASKLTHDDVGVCLFKKVSSIPCPSCGSTRAVVALLHGQVKKSIFINPMGLIIAFIMLLSPFWVVYDIILKKDTLFKCYVRIEAFIRKPIVVMPLVVLVVVNWIWNITKGL